MECKDILNLIAIIVIPIVAVLIGQHLQNRAEIRKDKMHIFKVLMTSRIYGWTQESVHCLIHHLPFCFSNSFISCRNTFLPPSDLPGRVRHDRDARRALNLFV